MDEIYDEWNKVKKELAERDKKFIFKTGEIWWCSLGLNIGSESFGKGRTFRRPILVLKKLSKDTCIAVPLTTKEKIGSWFAEVLVSGQKRWAMLYQIRMIHTRRFQRRIAPVDGDCMKKVKEKLETLLELS